jgi:hypothetical protein
VACCFFHIADGVIPHTPQTAKTGWNECPPAVNQSGRGVFMCSTTTAFATSLVHRPFGRAKRLCWPTTLNGFNAHEGTAGCHSENYRPQHSPVGKNPPCGRYSDTADTALTIGDRYAASPTAAAPSGAVTLRSR